jgi:hypothetical protein
MLTIRSMSTRFTHPSPEAMSYEPRKRTLKRMLQTEPTLSSAVSSVTLDNDQNEAEELYLTRNSGTRHLKRNLGMTIEKGDCEFRWLRTGTIDLI